MHAAELFFLAFWYCRKKYKEHHPLHSENYTVTQNKTHAILSITGCKKKIHNIQDSEGFELLFISHINLSHSTLSCLIIKLDVISFLPNVRSKVWWLVL